MSGARHKQKGDRLERVIVALLEAHGIAAKRVPLSGSAKGYPGDVIASLNGQSLILGKSRADFKTLYQWLENRNALILKVDRREALAVLRLSEPLRLIQREGGNGKP